MRFFSFVSGLIWVRRTTPSIVAQPWPLGALVAIAVLFTFFIPGCVETRVVDGTWERWRDLGDPESGQSTGGPRVRGQTYSIKLKEFYDQDKLKAAYDFANEMRRSGQIADVWFVNRGDSVVVYTGKYNRPDHPEALAQLKAVRQAKIDGRRLFAKATLEPIDRSQASLDEHDLSQFSGKRTLLFAIFDPEAGNAFRAKAEEFAAEMREQHEMPVYFYHGPNQSLITAGLFTQADFVAVGGVDQYGPRIRELQETFPHTLRNGEYITNPESKEPEQREKTVIVRVP